MAEQPLRIEYVEARRVLLDVLVGDPGVEGGLSGLDGGKGLASQDSRRRARWNRSTLPVVVGERGAVSRWRMPFSLQIRSKSTSPVPGPKRPVNTLPLSVRIWSGTPWRRMARARASQVGRAVARATT